LPSGFRLFPDASAVRVLIYNLIPKVTISASPRLHWSRMPYKELSLVKWERYQYITEYKSIFGWARSDHSPFYMAQYSVCMLAR